MPLKATHVPKRNLASVLPILDSLSHYEKQWLRLDLIAGLTLAAYAIPVSIAYASLAGLPAQTGLYCYLVGGIAYALFGTSRQMAIGPTSAISILIGSALGTLAGTANQKVYAAAAVAVIAGVTGILAWILRLGNLTNFVSETVLSGFKVGAGLVIASTQLPKLLGISSGGNNFFQRTFQVLRHLPQTNIPSLAIGLGVLTLLILGSRFLPGRPISILIVVISIILMSRFPLADAGVKIVGTIPSGLPKLVWPAVHWSEVDDLLGLALACFLLAYVEGIAVARTFATKHGYAINPGRELLAIGVANLAAGVTQGYPLAGGMSQSAVNDQAGARTQVSLLVASAAITGVLLFLTGFMRVLPQPVLAAIVLHAIRGLIHPRELRHLAAVSKMEFRIAMVAAVAVLFFGILKGVLLAAIFSILYLLRRASHPRIAELGRIPGSDRFADLSRAPSSERIPQVLALRIESGLFYFNSQNAETVILKQSTGERPIKLVVLDLSTSANIDLAGVRTLISLHDQLRQTGAVLALAEVHGQVRDMLQAEMGAHEIPGSAHRTAIPSLIRQHEPLLRAA